MIVVVYNLLMLALLAAFVRRLTRREAGAAAVVGSAVLFAGVAAATGLLTVLARPTLSGFLSLRLMAYGLFVHLPLYVTIVAWLVRERRPGVARLGAVVVVAILAVGVDAFVVEPRRLQLTRHVVESPHLRAPLRIAVLADLQTDDVGTHEAKAVRWAMEARPDLVLLPGDFIQTSNVRDRPRSEHDALQAELAAIFVDEGLAAPLGVFAVGGDIDGPDWRDVFDGVDVEAPEQRASYRLRDDVVLTALHLAASHAVAPRVPRPDGGGLHVVVGHGPNFALGPDVDGDLLIAGHTHGGQVQLPLIGPLITLSRVPRAWAAGGVSDVRDGVQLVVSRGVGLERGAAPRLRFLCPPEVVIIDVVPARGALPSGDG